MMKIRLATPDEAEHLWFIRNQAIRHGCTTSLTQKRSAPGHLMKCQ